MNKQQLRRIIWWGTGCIVVVIGLFVAWQYAASYREVTFKFDDSLGYLEIIGDDNQKLYPIAGQPARLKKGDYTATNIGKDITPDTRTITLGDATNTIDVTFNYTDDYLQRQYVAEQAAIEQILDTRYPAARELYILSGGALYGRGDIYGAILTARDQTSDHADTLRVLMRKHAGEWQLVTTPPRPLLTTTKYPQIDRDILSRINQVK